MAKKGVITVNCKIEINYNSNRENLSEEKLNYKIVQINCRMQNCK